MRTQDIAGRTNNAKAVVGHHWDGVGGSRDAGSGSCQMTGIYRSHKSQLVARSCHDHHRHPEPSLDERDPQPFRHRSARLHRRNNRPVRLVMVVSQDLDEIPRWCHVRDPPIRPSCYPGSLEILQDGYSNGSLACSHSLSSVDLIMTPRPGFAVMGVLTSDARTQAAESTSPGRCGADRAKGALERRMITVTK
ncbi:uncharacterized protein K489DRAFT_17252 [Dissoconium aciculare CBS 342.82]|uniref:Uncharacterized protein n=1 Tax=Dissoconium aciculare CBS 342.82 TaxID=1314786 RepID=A0A6J3MHU7_9PEZI|nr:uncharacterized protein K489DRAFT_17252 [Dissoconium aciculare CBS 342.82]KAF1827458.1 hypothetical protein K489DRAFT_17252 [Dissoconium aciculare CBS 342.82]